MKKLLLCLVFMIAWAGAVITGTISGWFHKAITPEHSLKSFYTAIETELKQKFVGNFALAEFNQGKVLHEIFHSAGKPVDRNTVFQVASLSKWISAVGVMKLVEKGKIDLDAPVNNYLTRWKLPSGEFNNDEVTVRRLLSHTGGLTDGLGYSGFETDTAIQSLEQSLTKASDKDELANGEVHVGIKPGTAFHYSGGGYTLLQLIIEEVSHQSFQSYMKSEVLDPLGMIHSTYVWDTRAGNELAEFYNSDSTRTGHRTYTALAATSLFTSLSDLEIFFRSHLKNNNGIPVGGNVISDETLKMMRKPLGEKMGVPIWGLGTVLYATTEENDFIIGHDGKSTPPINTAVRLNPITGDGIIILETGNPNLATTLASEWVFWKTGQVDTFLFPTLISGMIYSIMIGWCVIIGILIVYSRLRMTTR